MKNKIKAVLLATSLILSPVLFAAAGSEKVQIDIGDQESLQRGAQMFTNYCLSCHSASVMRYNRLEDLGLTAQQIQDNLMFTTDKIGDTMVTALDKSDAVAWFGAPPPDLSLIARSRNADYLYRYLRGFYRDPTRPSNWNNTVLENAGMPHALWEMQGVQAVDLDDKGMPIMMLDDKGKPLMVDNGVGTSVPVPKLHWESLGSKSTRLSDGTVNTAEYDALVQDVVNFLVYLGEPAQVKRHQIGYWVLIFLIVVMLPLAYYLNKEYWKDVH